MSKDTKVTFEIPEWEEPPVIEEAGPEITMPKGEALPEPEPITHYDVVLLYNSDNRICNYYTTDEDVEKAEVPIEEWERFNQLAGRQHKLVDGVVEYDENLEPCLPDPEPPGPLETVQTLLYTILGVSE